MAAIVVIFILILLGGLGYYGYTQDWFGDLLSSGSSGKDDDSHASIDSMEDEIKDYADGGNSTVFDSAKDVDGDGIVITLNGSDIKSLMTTNGFIRPNSINGMEDKIVITTVKTKSTATVSSGRINFGGTSTGSKPSTVSNAAKNPIAGAFPTFGSGTVFTPTTNVGNKPVSGTIKAAETLTKPTTTTVKRIKLWRYNADRIMKLSNSILAADDKEVITMLNPYLAPTRAERISLAKRMCSIPYENGLVETGSADPVTGEYVCARFTNFFHEAKSNTYARVKEIVHSDYHDAITPGQADTLIPPHSASKDMNWTNTREWARQFCQGGKLIGGHRQECRVCLETYYGECGYGNRKVKGNHC